MKSLQGGPTDPCGFLSTMAALPPVGLRAVIINVGTELVSTLAIAAVAEHAGCPLLVVNCGPSAESRIVLDRLRRRFDFDLVEAPVMRHGHLLDAMFGALPDELILLVDSDAEVRDPGLVANLERWFDHPRVFGAGWYEGGRWMHEQRFGAKVAVYHERMWIPLVMLRRDQIAMALDHGQSFDQRMLFNDVRWSEPLSRLLARRFPHPHTDHAPILDRLPPSIRSGLEKSTFAWLGWARSDWYGFRPNYVYADTGALLYGWCRRVRAWHFAGPHVNLMQGEVNHFGGVTRRALRGNRFATSMDAVAAEVIERLGSRYGISWEALAEPDLKGCGGC